MKICTAQIRIHAANPAANCRRMLEAVADARTQGVQLLIFSELCVPGYFVGDHWERAAFLSECEAFGEQVEKASVGITVVFGNVAVDATRKNEDGRVRKYNAVFVAHNGRFLQNTVLGVPYWPKALMPNYREFDDSRHFFDLRKLALERGVEPAALMQPFVLEADGMQYRLGISICEDGWPEDYSFSPLSSLAEHKLHLLLNLSCSPYGSGKLDKRTRNFSALAKKTGVPILFANCIGTQNLGKTIFGFDGSSCAFDAQGNKISEAPAFQPHFSIYDFHPSGRLTGTTPLHPGAEKNAELCTALESIVGWVLEEWKIQRVVVGLSGGIDSALSAVLFSRILGAENVFAINMPSKFNSALTRSAAEKLAKELGCPYAVASIQASVDSTLSALKELAALPGFSKCNITGAVSENIQARDRGSRILAAAAAALGGVFSCNANKTEMTVGYSTLYGDAAGFLAPIADLWKHQVYDLARHYNSSIFGRMVVPQEIFEVMPSAELSADQDVTQGKGDPLIYPYHDFLFRSWIERWKRTSPPDIVGAYDDGTIEKLLGCEAGIVAKTFTNRAAFTSDLKRWWTLYCGAGAIKRMQAPPVVAVSPRAFGFDHRESLMVDSFDGFLSAL